LIQRLSADEIVSSRAFTTVADDSKRPTASSTSSAPGSVPVRHINTSRALKAPKDSSTIDFVHFPDYNPDGNSPIDTIRVPLLPQPFNSRGVASGYGQEVQAAPVRPAIMTVSADNTQIHTPAVLSVSDATESNGIDFQGMTERIRGAAQKFSNTTSEESTGVVKQIWNDFLDDVFGPKTPNASKA